MLEEGFWIIVLEALVALAVLAGIVWWTLPKRNKDEDEKR